MVEQKMAEQKLVGTLRDPKCKDRKVSGTKRVEQKIMKQKFDGDPQGL